MAKEDRLITYKGETKSIKEWAVETRLQPRTLRRRIERYDAGDLTLDECFNELPHKYAPGIGHAATVGALSNNFPGKGKRVRAIEALFDAFIAEGLSRIPEEMRHYMQTGEVGNAMSFYLKYKDFFPKDKLETLDEVSTKQMAAVAVVFQEKPPQNITILEQ